MTRQTKRLCGIYCLILTAVALVGIAYAEADAACHATWLKVLNPDGSADYTLACKKNDCAVECEATGMGGFGIGWATCKCPGEFIHCNAAVRNIAGWSSEEQCLGGCEQPGTLCPDVEEDPWTFDGWEPGGRPRFKFVCECEAP
jgi:hypothetical protein